MIVTAHSNTLESSTSPAEKASTGCFVNSASASRCSCIVRISDIDTKLFNDLAIASAITTTPDPLVNVEGALAAWTFAAIYNFRRSRLFRHFKFEQFS